MTREVVLGVDSSTQSTKVLAIDLESGEFLAEGRAPHSGENLQDPRDWWQALKIATRAALRPEFEVRGISVAGQQHGLVTLDAAGEPTGPAPLWNNLDSADDAERLNEQANFAEAVGSRLVASVTITKLAHLARSAHERLSRAAIACLPHDYLNWRLTGELTTDRGEASGSGWWSPATGEVRTDLLELAIGSTEAGRLKFPRVLAAEEPAGTVTAAAAAELGIPAGIEVGPGSGDNPAAAVGVGATENELVISLGTSGTAYAVSSRPTADPTGEVAGFADATGRFLPLTCMLNCTRVFDSVASLFQIERERALELAGNTAPGADGLLLMPYLSGERTPNLPHARGSIFGLTAESATPELMLRAALDGVAAGLAYCVEALDRAGVRAPLVTLVGGGSRHRTWQQAIADAVGLPVKVRGGAEHVARGAAVQIAAILRGVTVAALAAEWRPEVIASAEPVSAARSAFQLDRRRSLIDLMREARI